MTSVKLTSDGYSFHTMELKIHPDSKKFTKALKSLYHAAQKSQSPRTYPMSKCWTESVHPHCSTLLNKHGILLYLTEKIEGGYYSYTIKAIVDPRKVLEPESGYLGIAPTDSDSLDRFQDEFTVLMRKYHLPEFLEEWTLTRLDLCVNLQLDKKKSAREFCRLLQKDLLPSKLKRVSFFNPNSSKGEQKRQKDRDRHSVCLTNGSYEIVIYDKLFQVKTEDLDEDTTWENLPDGILRVELRCFSSYLDKLHDKKLKSTAEQIFWLAQHSRELILKNVSKAFSSGTHYKPDAAKELIDASDYHGKTQKQLWWLFKRMRYPFTLEQLEKRMKKQFDLNPRTVNKRLTQLQALGINLIPLRKDFYLDQLPSLPLLLELLEDDSTTLQIKKNGEIE